MGAAFPEKPLRLRMGSCHFTVNQLHRGQRFHEDKDLRQKPYSLFRIRVDAPPVILR